VLIPGGCRDTGREVPASLSVRASVCVCVCVCVCVLWLDGMGRRWAGLVTRKSEVARMQHMCVCVCKCVRACRRTRAAGG